MPVLQEGLTMVNEEFDQVVIDQLKTCRALLGRKGDEYSKTEDRLRHFKKAAALTETSPKEALFGMLLKHLVSVSDMCKETAEPGTLDRWTEKITDTINYMLLLKALVIEEAANEKNRSQGFESGNVPACGEDGGDSCPINAVWTQNPINGGFSDPV